MFPSHRGKKPLQKSINLLPSGLYRRLRNHTGSCHKARGLASNRDAYRRSGISPCPEDYNLVSLFIVTHCKTFYKYFFRSASSPAVILGISSPGWNQLQTGAFWLPVVGLATCLPVLPGVDAGGCRLAILLIGGPCLCQALAVLVHRVDIGCSRRPAAGGLYHSKLTGISGPATASGSTAIPGAAASGSIIASCSARTAAG